MEGGDGSTIFKDIRRYYCEYCGICRSKKSLISSHILSCHQEEVDVKRDEYDGEKKQSKDITCEECGVSFRKPAHLKQHMQSYSLEEGGPPEKLRQVSLRHALFHVERPFTCTIEDCRSSYRRKDHLNRHLLQHQGKLFECPVSNCNRKFAFQGNMKRHVNEFHDDPDSSELNTQKQFVCPENGCGKVFKYASKLRKHEDSHVKLNAVEVFCSEPGCMKYFTNEQCLRAHLKSCHNHITCETCGTKQLKKNIKRHLRTHEGKYSSERIQCSFKGCLHTFSNKSNLQQHVKVVHFEHKAFVCSFPGCGIRFSYKHVRDNHEKTARHLYTSGNFLEADEMFRSRPRGGRKRKLPTIEALTRKRVVSSPSETTSYLNQEPDYVPWLLSSENEDQL